MKHKKRRMQMHGAIQAVKWAHFAGSGCLKFGFAVTIRLTCRTPVYQIKKYFSTSFHITITMAYLYSTGGCTRSIKTVTWWTESWWGIRTTTRMEKWFWLKTLHGIAVCIFTQNHFSIWVVVLIPPQDSILHITVLYYDRFSECLVKRRCSAHFFSS